MITNTANKVIYTGNGTNKEFDVPFDFNAVSEIALLLHVSGENHDTPITANWSYDENTRKITYPVSGAAIPSSQQLVILRNTPQTQLKDHDVRLFTSEDVEDMADKLTREMQDVQEQVNRALKYPASYTGPVDSEHYLDTLEGLVEQGTVQANTATAMAQEAAAQADVAEGFAQDAQDSADAAKESEDNAKASELAAAQSAASAANDADNIEDVWTNLSTWLNTISRLKDGDIKSYTAGTSTSTYDGSLTVFPVENHFDVPINVYVNGQYKEITTEYTEDKTNNVITFTTALHAGDRVNIVSNIAIAELADFSEVVAEAINDHNASLQAHSSLISAKQNVSNLTTTLSSSSTDTQYPSAKAVYDQLALKATKAYADEIANAKLSLTGGRMTGNLVMDDAAIEIEDTDGDSFSLSTKKDQNDNVTFEVTDKTTGAGVVLDGSNGYEPFYTDGVNTPDKLLKMSDKAVANGVATLDANVKVPNAQIPAATAIALGGVMLVYDSATNTLDIRTA